ILGRPNRVDDSARAFQSWQYDTAPEDGERDDNSPPAYILCVRTSDQQLLILTRNFTSPQDVEELLPVKLTSVYHWPSAEKPQSSVRLRPLSGETLLIAMGTARAGERTSQLILIRRSELKTFIPWLAAQLQ